MVANSTGARETFLRKNSPDGLLLRYAGGRLRGFWMRQVTLLLGAGIATGLGSLWLGFLAAGIVVLGEALEAIVLQIILRRPGRIAPVLRALAVAMAALQAATVSLSTWICWETLDEQGVHFLALIFLLAAVTNAALARRHFPEGTLARFWVYGLTSCFLLIDQVTNGGGLYAGLLALAAVVLFYNFFMFLRTVEFSQRERHRFEEVLLDEQLALRKSQVALERTARLSERLAFVARFAGDSVVFITPDGRIEWVNEAFTRITGYSFDDAVGRNPSDLLGSGVAAPEALRILSEALRRGTACRVELQNRRQDGGLIWMDINMSPVLGANGVPEVFISVERDVTEAKAQEVELAAVRLAAEAASEAKSQFVATMSHEIRTPLNGVIGVAELLADTRLSKAQAHYVATIVESGRALLSIINDVLDLSKLGAGKMDIASEPFSLFDLVAGSLDLLRPVAHRKGITLTMEAGSERITYIGDAGRLRQVLLNLIGNAVKFTEAGGVQVVVENALDGASGVKIHVQDSGIGISAEGRHQIFESFAQADSSISRRFGGTGLGLTISRELVRRMGGDITLQSEPGEGSVFTVMLPLQVSVHHSAAAPVVSVPETNLTVLVAEDNRTNLMIIQKLLEPAVDRLLTAGSGAEAVEIWRTETVDLILMDISMPGMDGLTATRLIREAEVKSGRGRVPIYALTAFSQAEHLTLFRDTDMDGALSKPFVRGEIYALLFAIANATVPPRKNHGPRGPGTCPEGASGDGQGEENHGRYRHAGVQP